MAQDGERKTYLTPEVLALIGHESEVREMWGVVDAEMIRRYVLGIPDQDPRHWDEELAKPRFGTTTTPSMLFSAAFRRRPPWDTTTTEQDRDRDEESDGMRVTRSSLQALTGLRRHLNGGSEVELYRYPKIGDHLYAQSRNVSIEERVGSNGQVFLLSTSETRYWNQDNETIAITRGFSITR